MQRFIRTKRNRIFRLRSEAGDAQAQQGSDAEQALVASVAAFASYLSMTR